MKNRKMRKKIRRLKIQSDVFQCAKMIRTLVMIVKRCFAIKSGAQLCMYENEKEKKEISFVMTVHLNVNGLTTSIQSGKCVSKTKN